MATYADVSPVPRAGRFCLLPLLSLANCEIRGPDPVPAIPTAKEYAFPSSRVSQGWQDLGPCNMRALQARRIGIFFSEVQNRDRDFYTRL